MVSIAELFKYDVAQTQDFSTFILAMVFGILVIGIVMFIFYKIFQAMTYKVHINFYKKVGPALIQFDDKAREFVQDDQYYYHYKGINKLTVQWDPEYQTIVQKKSLFGLLKKSYIGFHLYMHGKKIVPMKVSPNPGIKAYDMDMFNFMQSRIKTNIRKYQKQNWLVQMAPLLGLGLVVFMFIIGMIFYGKHIENVANIIINGAKSSATEIVRAAGIQNIPAK